MNLAQSKNLAKIVLAIAASLLILVIASFLVLKGDQKEEKQPEAIPQAGQLNKVLPPAVKSEELPKNIQQVRQKIIASQIANRQGDLLLYQADLFEIEYIPAPDVFFVTILKDPANLAKTQATDWFLKFGLKKPDLCDLPVRFLIRDRNLRKSNPGFSSSPEGCPS